jgi:hypothetical protein
MAYSTAVSPRRARRLPSGLPRLPRGGVPRAAKPGGDEEAPLRLGPERAESAPDGDWVIRAVPGAAATKTYRCPGCDQEIPAGTAHVVVWPAFTPGVTERRHWHSACWERRLRRRGPARRPGR